VSELVRAELPDGTAIWVRTGERDGGGDISFGDDVTRRLGDLPGTLDAVTRSVREGLRNAAPDEVSLEFGIEIAVRSGGLVSVLTEAGATAALKVTVTWRRGEEPRTTVSG
jgi:hypothetical protein